MVVRMMPCPDLAHGSVPKKRRLLVLALLFLALVPPVAAAERVKQLPPIKAWTSARFEAVLLVNDQPFAVAKGEVSSPQRGHFVFEFVAKDAERPRLVEVVAYDGVLYVRKENSTQWQVTQWGEEGQIPDAAQNVLPLGDIRAGIADFAQSGTLSLIGSEAIAGTSANHYQVWIPGPQEGVDHIAFDFWIGRQVNYVYQTQFSFFGQVPDLGNVKSQLVERFYDIDAPGIAVGRPANISSRVTRGSGLIRPLPRGSVLETMAAPLTTPQLRQIVVERLAR